MRGEPSSSLDADCSVARSRDRVAALIAVRARTAIYGVELTLGARELRVARVEAAGLRVVLKAPLSALKPALACVAERAEGQTAVRNGAGPTRCRISVSAPSAGVAVAEADQQVGVRDVQIFARCVEDAL